MLPAHLNTLPVLPDAVVSLPGCGKDGSGCPPTSALSSNQPEHPSTPAVSPN